jgi:sulfoxide reductase heme-binding subunit YedZ
MQPQRERSWIILGTALLLALCVASAVALLGWSEEAARLIVRMSARVSVVLFSLAFSASALQTLFPSRASAALLRNRRYVGLSLALSHSVHLACLVVLGFAFPDPFLDYLDPPTVIGGGIAYLFIYAMALTSTDAAVHRLGRARWRRLHLVGSWYIWIIFTQSYLPLAMEDPGSLAPLALVLLAASLRFSRWRRSRSAVAAEIRA